jgi:mRNA interferase MazF
MKRGEIWLVSGGADFAGKPRPAVILQDDAFAPSASVTLCMFTSNETEAPLVRVPIAPSAKNGLKKISRLMVDKITTVALTKIDRQIGTLEPDELSQLNQAVIVFLGLASSTRAKP